MVVIIGNKSLAIINYQLTSCCDFAIANHLQPWINNHSRFILNILIQPFDMVNEPL